MPKRKGENSPTFLYPLNKVRSNVDSDVKTSIQMKKLTCPVCFDKFKTPKILQCGHTFCQQCLHQLFQSKPVHCPVCKAKVGTSNKSAATLPTNFALKALVEEDAEQFDKDAISRSFGECPSHKKSCDQFCSTCERQLCKQCVSENHKAPDHDTSSVPAVVVQQTEIMEKLVRQLRDAAERLKGIEDKITTSVRTCETEASQLSEEINSSVTQSSQNVSDQGESLQTTVEKCKKDMLSHLETLRLEHSELSLSATYAIDLCESLQMDLNKNNLSRIAVIKRLNYSNQKIKTRLQRLEGKKNDFNLGLRFQSLTKEPMVGKVIRSQSSIPEARHMRTISLANVVDDTCLKGFVWPVHYWMMAVTVKTVEKHYAAEFYNMHFFVAEHFTHEIGIDDMWSYISNCDYSGKYALCSAVSKIHKLMLPSSQNERKAGVIVKSIFMPSAVSNISWDEKQQGCYALLKDRKTILHVDFEGQKGYEEVVVLEEEIVTPKGTHALHVNAEGSMAICDRLANVVHFFEKIGMEATTRVKATCCEGYTVPLCVNTQRGDNKWYVLWRKLDHGCFNYHLAVYDPSFKLLGYVPYLNVTNKHIYSDKAMFCFQEGYLALLAGKEISLHVLN